MAKQVRRVQVKAHSRKQPKKPTKKVTKKPINKPTKKVTKKTIMLSEAQMDQMIKENHPAVAAKLREGRKVWKKREEAYKKEHGIKGDDW